MALSRYQYVQDVAGNRNFIVPVPYISRDHIKISVAGEPVTYTWLNSNTIQLTNAPEVGEVIDINRETERENLLVNFQDGSTVTERQLDLSARQAFYLSQEAFDLTNSTMAVANDGSYSASTRRITNLGYPQFDIDAATKGYVKDVFAAGKDAFEERTLAETAREGAETARDTALAHRNTADDHRIASANSASFATTEANRATTEANRSRNEADRGVTEADRAFTEANRSDTEANRSRDEADRAFTEANRSRDEADRAMGFANGLNLPSAVGNGGKYLKQKSDETGLAYVDAFALKPIGEPFALWDHLTGVETPSNNGDVKFIKLTANDSYNDGLLINEVVSGSAPLVEAEAEIAVGPLTGQVVPLINTEQRFLRAGASGTKQMDQMQRVTGNLAVSRINLFGEIANNHPTQVQDGVFSAVTRDQSGRGWSTGSNSDQGGEINFDSANSPDARASSTTDGETRPKNITATYYMRIA